MSDSDSCSSDSSQSHQNDLPDLLEDHLTIIRQHRSCPRARRMRVTSSRRCNLGQRPVVDVTYFSYLFWSLMLHICVAHPRPTQRGEFELHFYVILPATASTFAGHDAQDGRKAWTKHENSRHHQPSTALRNKPGPQSEQWTENFTQHGKQQHERS